MKAQLKDESAVPGPSWVRRFSCEATKSETGQQQIPVDLPDGTTTLAVGWELFGDHGVMIGDEQQQSLTLQVTPGRHSHHWLWADPTRGQSLSTNNQHQPTIDGQSVETRHKLP